MRWRLQAFSAVVRVNQETHAAVGRDPIVSLVNVSLAVPRQTSCFVRASQMSTTKVPPVYLRIVVVELSGPMDLTANGRALGALTAGFLDKQLEYLGCDSYDQCPQATDASPLYQVDASDPPFLIAFLQLQFAHGIIQLDDRQWLHKQGRTTRRLIVDYGFDLSLEFGAQWDDVTPIALGDDGFLKLVCRLG